VHGQRCGKSTTPKTSCFARTIETWQAPIIAALQTGLTNARTEGCNRIAKHIGRIAFGFRNPDNQRRRVRWPAPADHGESHPAGTNATANCEEPG
jgi:transposase